MVRYDYFYGACPQIFLFFADRKLIEAPVALLLDYAEIERTASRLHLLAVSHRFSITIYRTQIFLGQSV